MRNFLTRISKARLPYEPLITIEISKSRLLNNLAEFKKLAPNHQIAPVLKSNAYGHGLIEVANILTKSDIAKSIPFFVVDSYFEAIALRSEGIHNPLLVIGYTSPETIARARLKNTSFTITSIEALRELSKLETPSWTEYLNTGRIGFGIPFFPKSHNIHIKIDTGMRRQGILPDEIDQAIDIIKSNSMLNLQGICSHLCDADNRNESFSEEQIAIWNRITKQFKTVFPHIKYMHLSNTDGHRFTSDINANVSRLGIGLYGLINGSLFKPNLNLQPIMEMKTIITGVKKIKTGETVGYGNTFTAMKDMTIATIPVGYFEGIDRRLSNKGFVQVGSNRLTCPIVGRVSMNITTIDVSSVPNPKNGVEIVVISNNASDLNSIANIAKLCGVITHESTVRIPAHLKRVVVE